MLKNNLWSKILYLIFLPHSKQHNTGAEQKWVVHDVMLFRPSDWTIVSVIAFDWLSKYVHHARSISVHLACSTVMVFAVILQADT